MCETCIILMERLGNKSEELGYAKETIRGLLDNDAEYMKELARQYLEKGYKNNKV